MAEEYKTISLVNRESLSSIEDKTKTILLDLQYKVRFTSGLKFNGALGLETAILQFIGTWVQKNNHKKVFHSYQKSTAEDFSELCESIFGIAALSMADEIWSDTLEPVKKRVALEEAKQVVENLRLERFEECFTKKYFGVPYIKTPRFDKEFEMPFYNNGEVIGLGSFQGILNGILSESVSEIGRFGALTEQIDSADLGSVVWELLKNTHDHGRSQPNKKSYLMKNFRSVVIQQQNVTDDYLQQWCGDKPSAAQAAFRESWIGKSATLPFLDLSVVDFGSGFLSLAKDKVVSDDPKVVFLKCMDSGWSRLSDRNRGDGLTKVLQAVHKYKGWLRIRTGNILLEKTFVDGTEACIHADDITVMPADVAGTSVHIAFPLKIENAGVK
ncbi:MAG: hypothetical protein ACJA2D_002414 [Pseudohongiellaceae bacterium]|jgi:hypothetical protein